MATSIDLIQVSVIAAEFLYNTEKDDSTMLCLIYGISFHICGLYKNGIHVTEVLYSTCQWPVGTILDQSLGVPFCI